MAAYNNSKHEVLSHAAASVYGGYFVKHNQLQVAKQANSIAGYQVQGNRQAKIVSSEGDGIS